MQNAVLNGKLEESLYGASIAITVTGKKLPATHDNSQVVSLFHDISCFQTHLRMRGTISKVFYLSKNVQE
ncbi:hypothetical protein V5799_027072 [Amblyomma americanum]|uniref:Uncharacterized protein n=1 Tax=Amblyomma americanum TaxID=6943 RepID=A0AAQ4DGS1_AMBAM